MMMFVLQLHERPKCQERKCGTGVGLLENQAERSWTSRQVLFLIDVSNVAGDALDKPWKKFAQ